MLRVAVVSPSWARPIRHLQNSTRCFATAAHAPVLGRDIRIAVKSTTVGSRTLQMVFPDLDQVMDYYIGSGQGDRDPYWCDVWPSAVVAAQELGGLDLRDKSITDLGCGLGIVGIFAALEGCRRVRLLDQEPLALQCAALSAMLNGLCPESEPELWPTDPEILLSMGMPKGECCNRMLMLSPFNWNQDNPTSFAADIVVASDVLYEAAFIEPLARTLPKLLSSEESQLLLVDPVDRTPAHRAGLLDRLTKGKGGELMIRERRERCGPETSESRIQILILQKRSPGDTLGIKTE